MALSVTHIAAHALDKHSKEIADAVIEHNLLSAWLKASNRVRIVKGGLTFHEKVMYSEAGGYDWIAKDAEIPLNTTDTITDAEYNIRILAGPLKIYDYDKRRAAGDSQVADLVETTIENAKTTMSNKMGVAIFNDGGATNALHGMQLIASATAGQTVGGISSSSYTWWDNVRDTTGTASFNTSQNGISLMTSRMAATAGNDHDWPDLIVTTSTIWSLFQLSTTNVTRLVDSRVGALGYRTLDFMGTPVGWDFNCPANYMYFVNSKYLFLRILEGGEFVTSDWQRVQGQLADYATMHVYCQLTTNNRKRLGVQTAITG
jgi:hypothetical protein